MALVKLIEGKQINVNLTGSFTGSFTGDGSGLTNLPVQSINTGSFVLTSSFNSFTGSYNTGSFTGSFTGPLRGTSSWAVSSSYAVSGGNQNLQQILTIGHTAVDKFIVLYKSSSINPTSQAVITSEGYRIESGNKQGFLSPAFFALVDTSVGGTIVLDATDKSFQLGSSTVRTDLLTTEQVYQLPNATGTLALTSDIPVTSSFAVSSSHALQADNATNSVTSQESVSLVGFQAATVEQVNVGETGNTIYVYILRAQELEQSKHTTINIYNNLNFT